MLLFKTLVKCSCRMKYHLNLKMAVHKATCLLQLQLIIAMREQLHIAKAGPLLCLCEFCMHSLLTQKIGPCTTHP